MLPTAILSGSYFSAIQILWLIKKHPLLIHMTT